MSSFEIKGLEEFNEKLRLVEKKAPDRILEKLDNEGKQLRKAMKANTPKDRGKLQKGYKLTPVTKGGNGYSKGIVNKNPVHHLVNNGHRKVTPGGNVVGMVEGQFYVEKTVAQEEGPLMNRLDSWLGTLFEELK